MTLRAVLARRQQQQKQLQQAKKHLSGSAVIKTQPADDDAGAIAASEHYFSSDFEGRLRKAQYPHNVFMSLSYTSLTIDPENRSFFLLFLLFQRKQLFEKN